MRALNAGNAVSLRGGRQAEGRNALPRVSVHDPDLSSHRTRLAAPRLMALDEVGRTPGQKARLQPARADRRARLRPRAPGVPGDLGFPALSSASGAETPGSGAPSGESLNLRARRGVGTGQIPAGAAEPCPQRVARWLRARTPWLLVSPAGSG